MITQMLIMDGYLLCCKDTLVTSSLVKLVKTQVTLALSLSDNQL